MIDIAEYIKEPIEVRQKHLALNEPCLERGGDSTNHRGVLAQYLDTTIRARGVLLCHACNNAGCSNPRHIYWGTYKENYEDGVKAGTIKNPWEYTVEKYGIEGATELNRKILKDNDVASKGGKGNKGVAKSDEHKSAIAKSIQELNAPVV